MPVSIFQVDAFTAEPFAGNPAAVCLLTGPRDSVWMQKVAAEMNLAETAFLSPHAKDYQLRWFTPTMEVDLCGHATLASAHILWETGHLAVSDTARFHTRSGLLTAVRKHGWIELDFPATPEAPAPVPPGLAEALGASPVYVGRSRFDYLVELDSEDVVRTLKPDFAGLRGISQRGFIVTAYSDNPGYDFVSRFFAPDAGIDEDPVTGSSHCCLAVFWSRRLQRQTFIARQVSQRGGILRVQLDGDRVRLGGLAVTILRGELLK